MKRLGVPLFLLGLGAVALGVWWFRGTRPPTGERAEDPRLTYPTPYRNVRPEVRHVGDAACADCHEKESTSYQHHPMSRSLAPVASMTSVEKYGAGAGISWRERRCRQDASKGKPGVPSG